MENMTLSQIANAVNGKLQITGNASDSDEILKKEASSVVIDSRLVEQDGIFVAVKGEKTDGHSYIDDVIKKGALGVICERLPESFDGPDAKGAYIVVENTLKALRDLAAFYRTQVSAKIIGIVGSVGKTSTKELVASVLSQRFCTLKTEGNFNNEIGVPLTIFRIRPKHEIAVVEMGISDFGEMDRLGAIVKPDMVVMTNIGPCHLENLKDLDGVLRAKSEVIRHIRRGGLLIINSDDEKLDLLWQIHEGYETENTGLPEDIIGALKNLRIATYGEDGDAFYDDVENLGVEGSNFTLNIEPGDLTGEALSARARVHMQGSHMVMNSLAAAIAGLDDGMTMDEITKGIEAAMPVKGRCCPIHTDRYLVVDDSYNANPKSMMAAADMMDETEGRRVLILGDMFELGTEEKELHYEVGKYASTKKIDLMICVGPLSENIYNGYLDWTLNGDFREAYYFDTKEKLLKNLDNLGFKDGDVILVKASHGMGFAEVVDKLVEKGSKYKFIKGREQMQIDDIMQLLAQTHWACNRSRETVEKAIENSLCFGMLDSKGKQVAFGRTVTDYATMFYVSDVVLDKSLHKQGLGKKFVEFIKSAPELEYLWGFLGTTKAKGFYEKCGFEPKDDFFMAMPKTNVKGIFNV
ncbi:MAG: UDP-N-acetylmuramoyl-tripeptide--D-alanyl-D-alanine ligase [Lachnospiraceae bacterium]|nr:UDP-N-acetylmuramoyl-tripeptide--D-alanyl-D-alanine ligase [Lachnospiraceae bacterium]